jgi:hypothetical protein
MAFGPLLFTLKGILRQKKKNYGNSNIPPCKNIIFKKSFKKQTKNPSRYYYSSITNLEFQHKPTNKTPSFKNPHIKIDLLLLLLLLPRGQNPLQNQNSSRYYYSSITNLEFQHKPTKYHLSKILI